MQNRKLVNNKLFTILLVCVLMLFLSAFTISKFEVGVAHAQENPITFSFAQTSSTECSVRLLDKTIEKAIIPSKATINGVEYTVTSIATNGFAFASNLKKVRLPETIRTIGNTAFANCGSMKSITLPAVESIGTSAFNNCTSLEFLILPSSISLVAPTILRGCNTQIYARISELSIQELGWATNWNGNNNNQAVEYNSGFTPEVEYIKIFSSVSTRSILYIESDVIGYYVDDFQPFLEQGRDDVIVRIPAVFEGKPVVGIKEYAFFDNAIDNLIIGHANTPIHLESNSFFGLESSVITINRDVNLVNTDWQGNTILAESLFAYSSVNKVILPNSISGFGVSMFDGCSNLTDIHFIEPRIMSDLDEELIVDEVGSTGKVYLPTTTEFNTIGDAAFSGANSIGELYIPQNVTTVGASILASWGCIAGKSQRVIIDYEQAADLPQWSEELQQGWHPDWYSSCLPSIIEYNGVFNINYNLNGGSHSGNPTTYKSIDNIVLNDATRGGYTFSGWYEDEIFSANRVYEIKKGSSGNKELYAKWVHNEYSVTYNSNKPSFASGQMNGLTLDSIHYYNISLNLRKNAYALNGWTFVGWNTKADGSGTSYADEANVLSLSTGTPVQLYAQWEQKNYTVTYSNNKPSTATGLLSGAMDDSSHLYDMVSYLNKNNFTLVGWKFIGWNTMLNSNGIAYAEEASISTLSTSNITLYAQWEEDNYIVTYNKQGGVGGTSDFTATFDKPMPGGLTAPTRSGYTFGGYFSGINGAGTEYYNSIMGSAKNWNINENTTLYAKWNGNVYAVTLNKQDGSGGTSSVTVIFGLPMPINGLSSPVRVGYTFEGYYDGVNGTGTRYYNANMTSANNWDKTLDSTLYAKWDSNPYIVTLNKQGGNEGTDSVTAIFGSQMPLAVAPIRTGYTFGGYYSGLNGTGEQYYTSIMGSSKNWDVDENTTIHAKWTGNTYIVTLNKQGGSGGADSIPAIFGSPMPTALSPTQTGYTFDGYYSGINGGGTQFYNSSMGSVRNWDIANAMPLYANWIGNTYTITLDKRGGIGGTISVPAIFGSLMPTALAPTRTGYTFGGYYTGINGGGTQFYNSSMDSVINWDIANATTLYAKWIGNTYIVTLNKQGGSGGADSIPAIFGSPMPTALAPTRTGYTFGGYYTGINGEGIQYFDSSMGSFRNWDIANTMTLYAKWTGNTYIITLNKQGGSGGADSVPAIFGSPMPTALAPTRTGYTFGGYYTGINGEGIQYFDSSMGSVRNWDIANATTLYAKWSLINYSVIFNKQDGSYGTNNVAVGFGLSMPTATAPTRTGYGFQGYWTGINGTGIKYYNSDMTSAKNWDIDSNTTLYANWKISQFTFRFYTGDMYEKDYIMEGLIRKPIYVLTKTVKFDEKTLSYNGSVSVTAPDRDKFKFDHWEADNNKFTTDGKIIHISSAQYEDGKIINFYAAYMENSCVAEGTLITLADGSQKAVELLIGNEQLLVWNLKTGAFDTAPILFIDSDPQQIYEVINLYFSDGTVVKVISEHGFWNIDLNKYVFLRNDAAQYLGHWFNKQITDANGNMTWTAVQLTNVVVANEVTTSWSPVTYEYLCYYVNGMLSMPGATTGLINIFEVDAETMQYDQELMLADIEEFGLFTYEEFAAIIPVPQEIFDAFDAQYFKVSIGKGLIDWDTITELVERYAEFFAE